ITGVMCEDEDRPVVGRLLAPPAAPISAPLAANGAEHVSAHHIGAARLHQVVACGPVDFIQGILEQPAVEPLPTNSEGIIAGLVGTGHEAVEGDGDAPEDSCHPDWTARHPT